MMTNAFGTPSAFNGNKSFLATLSFSLFLGFMGGDRFYLRKKGAWLKLLTAGGVGIWYLVDLVTILRGAMLDGNRQPLNYGKNPTSTIKLANYITLGICLLALSAVATSGTSDAASAILLPFVAAVAVAINVLTLGKKSRNGDSHAQASALADRIDEIAASLGAPLGVPIALKKDEIGVTVLSQVGLIESRSTGSTYVGGSQGLSFRVMKNVSYRVGASKGHLEKNPETEQIIDVGTAIFTSKRVVFTGPKVTREWDFENLVNVAVEPNGVKAYLPVSNREKTSGLTWLNTKEITPGMALSIAHALFTGGLESAKQQSLSISSDLRAAN
jgi:TM2 domain-containing membrane protein YozV